MYTQEFKDILHKEFNEKRTLDTLCNIAFFNRQEDLEAYLLEVESSIKRLFSLLSAKDKDVLVLGEMGYGDCIWLYRYVKELAKTANSVTYLVDKKLKPLLAKDKKLPNIEIVDSLDNLDFDYFSWQFDLPILYEFECFSVEKYIDIGVNNASEYAVGICLGNTDMDSSSWYRNCPIEVIEPLLNRYNNIYNFSTEQSKYINIRDNVNDFLDTAKILNKMSFFICTDNVMLNLAGAMGIKTIALLNYTCRDEWIWKYLTDTSTTWYKSVTPFICKDYNCWWEVVQRIINDRQLAVNTLY